MDLRPTFLAATLALATLGAAHADGLRPIEARSIDLGAVTGTAYYTVDPDGYRVVATVAQGAAGTPVRFEAVLSPGQTVRLSTPGQLGVAADTIEISRRDDELLVRAAPLTN